MPAMCQTLFQVCCAGTEGSCPKMYHFRVQIMSELKTIKAQKTQKETVTFSLDPEVPKRI